MTITVGGTSITFNDGTTQTTAAGSPTTAQVLNATAGLTAGAVGSYAFIRYPSAGVLSFGSTFSGGYPATLYVDSYQNMRLTYSGTVSGTWRWLGYTGSGDRSVCLAVRIS